MGVFTNVLARAAAGRKRDIPAGARVHGGLGVWLMDRLRPRSSRTPRLRVLEQIRVTPRQVLVLVDVEGERLLMAASDVSAPAFYPVSRKAASPGRSRSMTIKVEGTCA